MTNSLGQQIAAARQAKQWTQKQLADRMHVHLRTVTNWESGATVPLNRVPELSQTLGARLRPSWGEVTEDNYLEVVEMVDDGDLSGIEVALLRLRRLRADVEVIRQELRAVIALLAPYEHLEFLPEPENPNDPQHPPARRQTTP